MPKKLPNAPMQFADFVKSASFIADKCKCGLAAYSKNDRVWVEAQRMSFLKIVWNACLREITPDGFNDRYASLTVSSDLGPFFSNEVRVEEWCPRKWRNAVEDWLVSAIHKNESKWMESRYTFIEKNGKKFVTKHW